MSALVCLRPCDVGTLSPFPINNEGFRKKIKVSTRFYPGEVTLGNDEVIGARRTGGGRYVLCWWEVIHTVALADIYPERDISPPGALRIDTDM